MFRLQCGAGGAAGVFVQIVTATQGQMVFIFEGCLTVHLPREIIWNANLMQQGEFINVFVAQHVLGTYAHHQEH